MNRSAESYAPQTPATLAAYLFGIPGVRNVLGGQPSKWRINEVGDGNLNLVFVVKGASGGVAVKQALPYVRLVGESWPLPLSRAHYEHMALSEQARLAGGLVPTIIHYDDVQALNYAGAAKTALLLLAVSYGVLLLVYAMNRKVWAVWPQR